MKNVFENGAVKMSKVVGTLDDYDFLQDEWDYTNFVDRVDLWFEDLNDDSNECIICWAVWNLLDDDTMFNLFYTQEI